MDLDLLKKLINLANNNPNDNEANAAARKVCKMIAENNFQFIGDNNPPSQRQTGGRSAWDVIHQEMRRQQEEMLRRHAREAQERDRQYREQRQRDREAYEAQQRARNKREEEERKRTSPFNPSNWSWVYGEDPHNPDTEYRKVDCLGGCGAKKAASVAESGLWVCDDCAKKNEQSQKNGGVCQSCGRITISKGVTICPRCMFGATGGF